MAPGGDQGGGIGTARKSLRQMERRADHGKVGGCQDRRRHGQARCVKRLQQRKFIGEVQSHPKRGRPVGAQHEIEIAADMPDNQAPMTPHRAAKQRLDRGDAHAVKTEPGGEDAREWRRRRAIRCRHRYTAPTACPPSTGRTAPVM